MSSLRIPEFHSGSIKNVVLILLLLALPCWAGRSFNGSTDQISIPGTGNSIDITAAQMSFSCWFMLTAAPSNEIVPCAKWSTSNAGGYMFNYNQSGFSGELGGHVYISIPLNHFQDIYCAATTINLNQWYSAVLVYQNNNNMKVWVGTNGTATLCGTDISVGSAGTMVSSGGPLTFGASNAGRTGSVYTQGKMGESGVWNIRLTDAQAVALASGVCIAGPSARRMGMPPPVGYFPFHGVASPEPDLSGNGNNGTLTGTAKANHPPCTP